MRRGRVPKPNGVNVEQIVSANVQFSSDGDRLFVIGVRTPGTFRVVSLDAGTGGTLRQHRIATLGDTHSMRALTARVSGDGSRFFCTGQSKTEFNHNGTGGTTLCFDIETGERITELPFDDGRQFILDDEGHRVALIRNVSGVRSLQVYDVDSGEATGEPIALSDDVDLLEMKSDGDRNLCYSRRYKWRFD